jgi:hypothetical protein
MPQKNGHHDTFKHSGPFILGVTPFVINPEPKIKDPKIKDPKIKDPKIKDPKIKDPKIKDQRPKDQCHGTIDIMMPSNAAAHFFWAVTVCFLSFTKCNGLQIKEGQGGMGKNERLFAVSIS